jgi:hypothetical protein
MHAMHVDHRVVATCATTSMIDLPHSDDRSTFHCMKQHPIVQWNDRPMLQAPPRSVTARSSWGNRFNSFISSSCADESECYRSLAPFSRPELHAVIAPRRLSRPLGLSSSYRAPGCRRRREGSVHSTQRLLFLLIREWNHACCSETRTLRGGATEQTACRRSAPS